MQYQTKESLKGHFLIIIIKHQSFPLNYYLSTDKYYLCEDK